MFDVIENLIRINGSPSFSYFNSTTFEVLNKLFINTINIIEFQNSEDNVNKIYEDFNQKIKDTFNKENKTNKINKDNIVTNIFKDKTRAEATNILISLISNKIKKTNANILYENIKEYFSGEQHLHINSETIKLIGSIICYLVSRLKLTSESDYTNLKANIQSFKYIGEINNSLNSTNNNNNNNKNTNLIFVQNMTNDEILSFVNGVFYAIKTVYFNIQSNLANYSNYYIDDKKYLAIEKQEIINNNNDLYYCLAIIIYQFDWLFPNIQEINLDLSYESKLQSSILYNNANNNLDEYIDDYYESSNSSIYNKTNNYNDNDNPLNSVKNINIENNKPIKNYKDTFENYNYIDQLSFTLYILHSCLLNKDCLRKLKIIMPYSFHNQSLKSYINRLSHAINNNKSNHKNSIDYLLDDNFHYLSFLSNINNLKIISLDINILDSLSFINILKLLNSNDKIKDLTISLLPSYINNDDDYNSNNYPNKNNIYYSPLFIKHLCKNHNLINENVLLDSDNNRENSIIDLNLINENTFLDINLIIPILSNNLELLLNFLNKQSLTIQHLNLDFTLPPKLLENEQLLNCIFKFIINLFYIIMNQYSQLETVSLSSAYFPMDPHKFPILNNNIFNLYNSDKLSYCNDITNDNKETIKIDNNKYNKSYSNNILYKISPKLRKIICLKSLKLNFYFFKLLNFSNLLNNNLEYLEIESLDAYSFLSLYSNLDELLNLSYLSVRLMGIGFDYEEKIFMKFFEYKKKPSSLRNIELKTNYELDDSHIVNIVNNINYDYASNYYIELKLKLESVLYSKLLTENINHIKRRESIIDKDINDKNSNSINYKFNTMIENNNLSNNEIKLNNQTDYSLTKDDINIYQNSYVDKLEYMNRKLIENKLNSLFNDKTISLLFNYDNTINIKGLKCKLKKVVPLKLNINDPACLGLLLIGRYFTNKEEYEKNNKYKTYLKKQFEDINSYILKNCDLYRKNSDYINLPKKNNQLDLNKYNIEESNSNEELYKNLDVRVDNNAINTLSLDTYSNNNNIKSYCKSNNNNINENKINMSTIENNLYNKKSLCYIMKKIASFLSSSEYSNKNLTIKVLSNN